MEVAPPPKKLVTESGLWTKKHKIIFYTTVSQIFNCYVLPFRNITRPQFSGIYETTHTLHYYMYIFTQSNLLLSTALHIHTHTHTYLYLQYKILPILQGLGLVQASMVSIIFMYLQFYNYLSIYSYFTSASFRL